MKTYEHRARSTFFLFTAAIIWGASFVAQKLAGHHMGAFTYNGVRFAMGCISLLPVIFIVEKQDRASSRRTWIVGIVGGVILFAASNLQQFGIVVSTSPTSASEAGFITGLYTVLVPLISLALGRKATILTWFSAFMAFAGLGLISVGDEGLSSIQLSTLFLIIGAVFWAVHILFIDHYVGSISPLRFAAIQFAVCSVLSMLSAFAFENVSFRNITDGIIPLLFGGVLSSGVAYTLQILGQRGVEPSRSAIIFSLEAVFAALSEALLLGEFMTPRKYLGSAVIFSGIILSQIPQKRKNTGNM